MENNKITQLIEIMQNSSSANEIILAHNEINQFLFDLDKTNVLKQFLLWQDLVGQYIEDTRKGVSIPYRSNDLLDVLELIDSINSLQIKKNIH